MCAHEMLGLGPVRQLPGIKAGERRHESTVAVQKMVSKFDHERIGPRLRTQIEKLREDPLLGGLGVGLSHQNGHRRRGP